MCLHRCLVGQASVIRGIASCVRACVSWTNHLIVTCRTCRPAVGELFSRHYPGGTRGLDGIEAGVSEHEVLEASYVVLAVCAALPGCLGEAQQ